MTLRDSIAALVDVAPLDATVPVRWLAEQLALDAAEAPSPLTLASNGDDVRALVDLTVGELAAVLNRSTSTIRMWIGAGQLPGAYRLHGREWRVPRDAIVTMQRKAVEAARSSVAPPTPTTSAAVDLGAWRRHLPSKSTRAGR